MKKITFCFCVLVFFSFSWVANSAERYKADEKTVTLDEVLEMANGSLSAQIARRTLLAKYWEYETVRKEVLPTLSFSGTLPQINRAFTKATLPDGRETFVSQFYGDYTGSLQLLQTIPQTNTQISLSSGLERLDLYGKDRTKSYLSTPIRIGITQSLFTYNSGKWEYKINPIRYNVAKQRYLQEREEVYVKAVELYFDLLLAQERYQNARRNRTYVDTLHGMMQMRYQQQAVSESEYLQLQLNVLQAKYEEENSRRIWLEALAVLKEFLLVEDNDAWILSIPAINHMPKLSIEKALSEAMENNAICYEFQQREIESQSNLVRAKSENRFSLDIYASFSLNQSAGLLAKSYMNLLDQEMLSVGLRIPILDWGKAKGKIQVAKAQKDVVLLQIEQERRTFARELGKLVLTLGTQAKKILLSERAMEVAFRRLEAEKLRYDLLKTDFSGLYDAINDKGACLDIYLEDMKDYWILYYSIRKTTLYDFEQDHKIEVSLKELL